MPESTITNNRYLDALRERILIFDGAMGTSLQKHEPDRRTVWR